MNEFETAKQLFFEGLQSFAGNDLQAAETKFGQSLDLLPERVSTLNNLSAIKLKLSKFAEAEELARRAVALDDKSPEAWSNLGLALTATGCHEEALHACDRAIACNSSNAMTWLGKAVALHAVKRYDEALMVCDQALKLDPGKYEGLYQRSLILQDLQRLDDARETYREALDIRVASSPVFIGERRATQKAEILIVNRDPVIDSSFRSFEDLSRFCPNFPAQLPKHLGEDFHFNYVFAGSATSPETRKQIPQPDFVINNHLNGESLTADGFLAAVRNLVESFGVPVVNHPSKALPTIRDLSAKLLAGIPGVRIPKTTRFSVADKTVEDLVREIETHYDYPLITRTISFQEGKGMNKVDSRSALVDMLSASDRPEKFFVTQFIDSRGANKFFRKLRAVVVKDEIIIARVDHDNIWKIYARKSDERVAFYLNNAYLLEEERRICKEPAAELGPSVVQSLHGIRERIPLDVFGIDFDVDPKGMVVFFEANATMNLFSTARKDVPNPKEVGDRLKAAFQRYFTSLLANRH